MRESVCACYSACARAVCVCGSLNLDLLRSVRYYCHHTLDADGGDDDSGSDDDDGGGGGGDDDDEEKKGQGGGGYRLEECRD